MANKNNNNNNNNSDNIVTCLVEYQTYRTVVAKELGKCVCAVTDAKLVAMVTSQQSRFSEVDNR
jgi:hypothetical protein